MGLFDTIKNAKAKYDTRKAAEAEARAQFRAALAQSSLVTDIVSCIDGALQHPDYAWMSQAVDYDDKLPRAIVFEGELFAVASAHYYESRVETASGAWPHGEVEYRDTAIYNLLNAGYERIDTAQKLTTSVGSTLTIQPREIQEMVCEIVYDHLKTMIPNATFPGREKVTFGSNFTGDLQIGYNLHYYVPQPQRKSIF